MRELEFGNMWRDFYDSRLGKFNDFIFKYPNKRENYAMLLFQSSQENYLLGVYCDYLSKLSKIDPSLIDEEEVRDVLSYDFCNIDMEVLDSDKYEELSDFYLFRLTNKFNKERFQLFSNNCECLLNNREGYRDNVLPLLNNNNELTKAYTTYLFNDIEEQQKLFERSTVRLEELMNGDMINEEDYSLLIENYKRLYLKKRIYEDILPLCNDKNINLSLLSHYFNYLNEGLDYRKSYLTREISDSKEIIPLDVLNDYYELSDKLDNNLNLITNKKNKILKK